MDLFDLLRGSKTTGADELSRHRFLPTRAGLLELLVLFALLVAVDRLIMSPGDFAKLQPHPFWLPVILLSLQYGTADGLLAATVAIIISMALGWPSQGIGEDYYRYIMRVWAVPICWLITSIVIGEVRARQRRQITELKSALQSTRDQAGEITAHCGKLQEKIQRLEREFATADVLSLDSLAAAFRDLRSGDAQAWTSALRRVHRGLIGTGSLSLIIRTDQAFVPITQVSIATTDGHGHNEPANTEDPRALGAFLDNVLRKNRTLNAQRPEDATLLDGIAAMAIPFVTRADTADMEVKIADSKATVTGDRMTGVILLDMIEPERLTTDTQYRLELLTREVAQALAVRGSIDLIAASDESRRIDIDTTALPASDGSGAEPGTRRSGLFQRFGRA